MAFPRKHSLLVVARLALIIIERSMSPEDYANTTAAEQEFNCLLYHSLRDCEELSRRVVRGTVLILYNYS
jgi:hypothetical protein